MVVTGTTPCEAEESLGHSPGLSHLLWLQQGMYHYVVCRRA